MSQAVRIAPKRVSFDEAASRLGVSHRSITNLVRSGQLEAVVVPGIRTRILESSLEALIARMNAAADGRQAG
jgi:excisionase family DNA binding protein